VLYDTKTQKTLTLAWCEVEIQVYLLEDELDPQLELEL